MGQELAQIGEKIAQTGSSNSCGYGNVDDDDDADEEEKKEGNDDGAGEEIMKICSLFRGDSRVTFYRHR